MIMIMLMVWLPMLPSSQKLAKQDWQNRFATALDVLDTPPPEFIASPIPLAKGEADGESLNDPTQRFAVYRNNVYSSLVNNITEGFAVVRQLVGDEFFAALASAYVSDNMPTSPVMYFYGDSFGDFIDGFPSTASTPYLGDIARLEYGVRLAMAAADVPVIKAKDMAAAAFLQKRATLHPSVQLLSSAYPIYAIWQRNTADPDQEVTAEAENVLVWREDLMAADASHNYNVRIEKLPTGGVEFFTALGEGLSVQAAAEAAVAAGGEVNLQALMQRMLSVTTNLTDEEEKQ